MRTWFPLFEYKRVPCEFCTDWQMCALWRWYDDANEGGANAYVCVDCMKAHIKKAIEVRKKQSHDAIEKYWES